MKIKTKVRNTPRRPTSTLSRSQTQHFIISIVVVAGRMLLLKRLAASCVYSIFVLRLANATSFAGQRVQEIENCWEIVWLACASAPARRCHERCSLSDFKTSDSEREDRNLRLRLVVLEVGSGTKQ
jgi:hypothetical protein